MAARREPAAESGETDDRGSLVAWATPMRFLYSVEEGANGWRVCRDATYLAEGLTLAAAIKQARRAGREHHECTGHAVTVELVIAEKPLLLAQYASRAADPAAAVAA